MKVLLINGSPHREGNTFIALSEVARTLESEGVQAEIVHIGTKAVQGCIACGKCAELGHCVFSDALYTTVREKLAAADGIVDGYGIYVYRTPVPASQPTVEGDSWRMVSAQKKHGHTYYGRTLNDSWQGVGLGITAKSYHYVGEIRNEFRNGYGRLFTPNNSLYQEGSYVNGALS